MKLKRSLTKMTVFAVIITLVSSFLTTGTQVQAAQLAYVQSNIASTANFVTSYYAALTSPVNSGDLIVVAISSWNSANTASVTSVTDNKGNTYSKVLENKGSNGEPLSIWYAKNVSGGSNFTVNANTLTNSTITLAVHEYSGFGATAALDVSANTTNIGTNASSGYTALTSANNELVFGAFNFSDDLPSITATAGTGYTLRQSQVNNHKYEVLFSEDRFVTSTGQYQSTLNFSKSVTWRGAVVTFKSVTAPTATPTKMPAPTATSILPTGTPAPAPTATSAPPTNTPVPATATPVNVTLRYFKVGTGYADIIPHQIVRTSSDKVYLFGANGVNSTAINVFWTTSPGVPASQSAFAGSLTYQAAADPISVDAVYDGHSTVHVLANLCVLNLLQAPSCQNSSDLYDYPFDLTTNTFKSPHLIASGNPLPQGYLYPGNSGVSGMIGLNGNLNVAYWSANNTITYAAFAYNPASDSLTPVDGPTRLDSAGLASHPVLAISPFDGSVTVAWISEAVTPHQILGRTKTTAGWGGIEQISNPLVSVWTNHDQYGGVSVDQGPSLIITSNGDKHLAYIEDADSTGNYGRVHYVLHTALNGWVDNRLGYYTHDPVLATNSNSDIYLFGHGLYLDPSPCNVSYSLCSLKKNPDGSWAAPQLFATPPSGETFDASVSTKWSVVGWTRPELIEVAFFSGGTSNYWNMNMYYGTLGGSSTSP